MFLTRDEEAVLKGEKGLGVQRAMELLVAIGTVYEAERLIPISSAHLSGVSYKTIGEGGVDFLTNIASDSKVVVKTTLNPAGMDLVRWGEMKISKRFAERQLEIIDCYSRLGVETNCTCTPYLAGNLPRKGDTVAWAESSALSYINSIVGARTNREGGPGALAASILGKTPAYGLHLDENRKPTVVIDAEIDGGLFDHTLLGQVVGKKVANAVPYFRNIRPNPDEAKTLAAAMAASGSVAMFHVEGMTPEANDADLKGLERIGVERRDLIDARETLSTGREPDLIAVGCPHLSEAEIRDLASILKCKSKKTDIDVWFCTSKATRKRCPKEIDVLERFGKVLCDTCMVVAPIEDHYSCSATNSAKACNYLPTLCSQKVVCASAADYEDGHMILRGRGIFRGIARGPIVALDSPFSFLGGVDPSTGLLSDSNDVSIAGKVLAFPTGKGSTVGSYTMLEMKRQGTLPAAILNKKAEPIVTTGAVMCGIPLVDSIDVSVLRSWDVAIVDGTEGTVEVEGVEKKSVVTCILMKRDRFLILKRSEKVGTFRGKWAGVSGYVEVGEEPIQTALKEMCEEVRVTDAELVRQADPIVIRSGEIVWEIHSFLFKVKGDGITTDWEHTGHRWIVPDELPGFDTVPGFDRVVEMLLSRKIVSTGTR